MHFAVGLVHAIDRNPLAFMTAGASELIRRMRGITEQLLTTRVGLKRVGVFLETRAIDRHMTGLAAIDPSDRLIESVAIELRQGDLLVMRTRVRSVAGRKFGLMHVQQKARMSGPFQHRLGDQRAVAC